MQEGTHPSQEHYSSKIANVGDLFSFVLYGIEPGNEDIVPWLDGKLIALAMWNCGVSLQATSWQVSLETGACHPLTEAQTMKSLAHKKINQ